MKLIIDIPKEKYEWIKTYNLNIDNDSIVGAVANGTPYEERPKGEWIPITMRPIEEEEKIDYPDATFMFDCPMPNNGQDILVSTKYGVEYDTCYLDDGYYLDSGRDWEEVYAWQPLPEPYKEGGRQ